MTEPKFIDLEVNCTVDLADIMGEKCTYAESATSEVTEVKE